MTAASPTPLERLERLSHRYGVDLRVKRDDLFPLAGGGNKARKLLRIVRDAESGGYDALVTAGGAQSNQGQDVALDASCNVYVVRSAEWG